METDSDESECYEYARAVILVRGKAKSALIEAEDQGSILAQNPIYMRVLNGFWSRHAMLWRDVLYSNSDCLMSTSRSVQTIAIPIQPTNNKQ